MVPRTGSILSSLVLVPISQTCHIARFASHSFSFVHIAVTVVQWQPMSVTVVITGTRAGPVFDHLLIWGVLAESSGQYWGLGRLQYIQLNHVRTPLLVVSTIFVRMGGEAPCSSRNWPGRERSKLAGRRHLIHEAL